MGLVAFGLRYSGVIETSIQQVYKYSHLKLPANFIPIKRVSFRKHVEFGK